MLKINWKSFTAALAMLFSAQVSAVTYNDDFTQPNDNTVNWTPQSFNGYPCMTAGSATNNTAATSSLPGCNWATPDAAGSGALRLTPAQNNQHSAILSQGVFPTNQGLQVTFTTYSYGGDSGGPASDGADGMSFFLMDGSVPTSFGGVPNLGSYGGSLGYSCSNSNGPYTGLEGAYLGLGMDTYGNFLNGGANNDNTATGIPIQQTSSTTNPNLSFGSYTNGTSQQANRIGLRGAGNVSWRWLNNNYPTLYPSTLSATAQQSAVQNTCKTGTLWSYGAAVVNNISAVAVSNNKLTVTIPPNPSYVNGDSVTIAGNITATPLTQSITTISNSGTTATLTISSTTAYLNGQSVSIGGNVTTTQNITSFSKYSSSTKTVRVNVASSSGYVAGQPITISGVTGTSSSIVNNTFNIASVGSGYFTIGVTGNPGTVDTTSSMVTAFIAGSYTIANVNSSANTLQISLPFTPNSAITNTSGTVTGAIPNVPNTYTIANVSTNTTTTFDVTLNAAASAVTNTSATATNTTQNASSNTPAQQLTTVMDYPVIPGGFWVLPDSTKIANEAAATRADGAWPITYRLRITPGGLLTYMYSYNGGNYQPVLSNFPITTGNGPLPSSFRFGFAASTGGSNNVNEIACFVAEPILSNSSASGNIIQGQQVKTTTKVFLAAYDPNSWSGSVAAYPIVNSAGTLSVSSTADWDTNCVLTGGVCQPMKSGTTTPTVTLEAPSARNILTWSGTAGIPLQWTNLTAAQKAVLNSTDTQGQLRLSWLRGDRTNEQIAVPAGNLRARSGVLGDVINSSPTWVGPPSQNYSYPFNDALYASSSATAPENNGTAQTYNAFATSNATRAQIVYTGSNDGMIHGSRAGANDSSGNFSTATTNNDGYEVLAFMPSTVLANSNVVSLTAPTYGHNYFVDAAPGYADLFYGNAWHTWMVGGLGAGGAEVYALDVTNPTNFAEANASTLVKGDWTPASVATCTNFTGACGTANMGNSYGTPIIRRLHNGKWAVIFGNGLGSTANSAGVFVGLVDPTTGAVSNFYWLDAFKNGTASNPNGISYVSSADLDGDHITDYLYAGDLQGNVWRFDLTSSNPADWRVTDFSNPSAVPGTLSANPSPLFTAKNSAGTGQPITTRIVATETFTGGAQRVILGFATGQASPLTNSSAVTFASGTQTVYGLWDWNLNNWNTGSTTVGGVVIPAAHLQLATLASAPSTQPIPRSLLSDTSGLLVQTTTTRGLQLNTVCWQGSSVCATNNQYGWLFDLPDTAASGGITTGNEQVIYNPTFSAGELVLNTTTQAVSTLAQCTPILPTGWTMAFNIESGGGATNNTGQIVNVLGSTSISATLYSQVGIKLNGVGSPFIVSVGSQPNIVTQTNSGTPSIKKFNPQGGVNVKRISWEQLR